MDWSPSSLRSDPKSLPQGWILCLAYADAIPYGQISPKQSARALRDPDNQDSTGLILDLPDMDEFESTP